MFATGQVMKRELSIIAALFLLSSCETNQQDAEAIKARAKEDAQIAEGNVQRHTMRVADNLRDQTKKTAMKMREWLLTPPPEVVSTAVPPSYCYKVMQDITCYRAPLPGQTHRLVGYQGDGAVPPLAQTKALPLSPIQKMNPGGAAARVADAKPVFVGIPAQPKEDKNATLQDGVPTAGSEPLPDPTLSPQL